MADSFQRWADTGDTRKWLEQTKIKTAPVAYHTPPPFPYQVFFDDTELVGPDSCPGMLIRHEARVEQYQEKKDAAHEAALEALLRAEGLDYGKRRVWLDSEKMYMTTYEFEFYEKRRDNNA